MEQPPYAGQQADQPTNPLNPKHLSRRTWLGRVSLPALTAAGAGLLGLKASASPASGDDKKPGGSHTFNVRDYGAKGDGKTLDTRAIQAAIDACYKD